MKKKKQNKELGMIVCGIASTIFSGVVISLIISIIKMMRIVVEASDSTFTNKVLFLVIVCFVVMIWLTKMFYSMTIANIDETIKLYKEVKDEKSKKIK